MSPRNFVGVLGHGAPTSSQSFAKVTFVGPFKPRFGSAQPVQMQSFHAA